MSGYLEQMKHEERMSDDEDYRQSVIDEMVKESMKEGREFYPFSMKNIGEAFQEIDGLDEALLSAYMMAAVKNKSNQILQAYVSDYVIDICFRYWKHIAEHEAEESLK